MKNIYRLSFYFLAAVLLIILSSPLHSQYRSKAKWEFSASGTYLFGGIIPTTDGNLNVVNNFGFLGDFDYKLGNNTAIGLSYTYIPTELKFVDNINYGTESDVFKFDLHYIFVNYLYEKEQSSAVPFFMAGFGGVLVHPKNTTYSDEFRVAANLGGGLKIYASKKVGFKLQMRLLMPYYAASVGLYGGGASLGYGMGASVILQADISAGLTFKF